MTARPSTWALGLLGAAVLLFALILGDAARLGRQRAADRAMTKALATRLGLTDLALFTESRSTRHLSQADGHAAFQDHPLAFDHFPSGSLCPPQVSAHARLD